MCDGTHITINRWRPCQGSVLSPLLFFMYANDISVDPMNNQVKISQFADDLGMWTFGPYATYVQYRIHKTLSALEKWCSKWRIKLNAKKTQLIVLKKNGRHIEISDRVSCVQYYTQPTSHGIMSDYMSGRAYRWTSDRSGRHKRDKCGLRDVKNISAKNS